jgi:20S proteasome alpha/beta subunit
MAKSRHIRVSNSFIKTLKRIQQEQENLFNKNISTAQATDLISKMVRKKRVRKEDNEPFMRL